MTVTEFNPTQLTWTALLGRWMDFARASVALPETAEGKQWRSSVTPIITLQAVTFALTNLGELPESEQALGLDRAEILIRKNVGRLNEIWQRTPMPPLLLELIHDARRTLRIAQLGTIVELVLPERCPEGKSGSDHAGGFPPNAPFVMPDVIQHLEGLASVGFDGGIALAPPGTLLMSGEPVGYVLRNPGSAWETEHGTPETEQMTAVLDAIGRLIEAVWPAESISVACPRQVYRLINESGRITGDLVVPMSEDPHPGRPLLLPALLDGRVQVRPIGGPAWEAQQRAAWPAGTDQFRIRFEDRT